MDPQKAFDELMSIVEGSLTITGEDFERAENLADRLLPRVLNGFTPTTDGIRGQKLKISRDWVIDFLRTYSSC